MKKKVTKNDDGSEKVAYDTKQRAELKFPGKEEGHEVKVWAAADNQWMKCALAPKNLASGDGKTDMEFKMENTKETLEASMDVRAGGYNLAGVYPYSALNVLASCEKATKAMTYEVAWSECFKFNSFSVGFENVFSSEDPEKKLASSIASMAWDSPFGLYWAGTAITGKNVTFNGMYNVDKSLKVAGQVAYCAGVEKTTDVMEKKFDNSLLFGLPISVRMAFQKKFVNGV